MNEQRKEIVRFVVGRLAIASVSLCIVITYAHTLNLFKRAEWLMYALSSHAFVLGYVAVAHLLAIPLYLKATRHTGIIENVLNSFTILASSYFLLGFYVLRVS